MNDLYEYKDKLWEALMAWSSMESDYVDVDEILYYLPGVLLFCVAHTPTLAEKFERLSTLHLNRSWVDTESWYFTDFWEEIKAEPDCVWFVSLLEELRFGDLLSNPIRCEYAACITDHLKWYSATPDEVVGYFEAILSSLERPTHNVVPPLRRLYGLVDMRVTLLAPKAGEAIYDPQCGIGDLLFAARQAAKASGNGETLAIYGQTWEGWDNFNIGVAKEKVILNNIEHAYFTAGKASDPPKFCEGEQLLKFDGVITTFVSDREFLNGEIWTSAPCYENELMQVYTCLKDTGRAVILILEESLYGQDYEKVRTYFVENDAIETVITLPEHILKDEPALAILVLNKAKAAHAKERIRFIHAIETYEQDFLSRRGLSDEQRDHIVQAANTEDDINGFARWVDLAQVRQQNCILCPDKYITITGLNDFLGGLTAYRPLGEIVNLIRGNHYSKDKSILDGLPIITDSDLAKYKISVSNLFKTQDTEYPTVMDNDILISVTPENENIYLCDATLEGVAIEESLYILRLNREYQGLAAYLAEYLRSDTGARQLRMSKRRMSYDELLNIERETPSTLLNILVPIPEVRVSTVLNALRGVELRLGERIENIRQLRSRLFNVKDPGELDRELEALSVQAQVLDASLLQVEDLNFQLRNYFPFPVVYAYRLLDAIPENSARYREQMRVAENLLAFLAAMGLSLAKYLGLLENTTIEALKRESLEQAWQKGISPGDLQQQVYACARLMRDHSQWPAINSFAAVWFKGKKNAEFYTNTTTLVRLKNDYKHDRGPKTPEEYEEAIEQVHVLLRDCLSQLRFLTQYPLHLVENLDFDHWTSTYTVTTLAYVGDHPGMQQIITQGFARPLTKGWLYMALDRETWIPLHPLVSVQYCPHCKMRETYFVDLWDGPGKPAQLKSFERGHVHRDDKAAQQIGSDLERWLSS